MKAFIVNFTILSAIVSCVYFQRHASEGGNFLEIPKKIADAVSHTARLLATTTPPTPTYSEQACANIELKYNASEAGTISAALFGSYRSENYLETNIMSKSSGSWDFVSYGISFIPLVVPWFILWLLGILIYIVLTCNQCCMVGCCKSCCTGCCRCCKKPKNDRKCCRMFSGVLAMICALGVIATSASGIVFAGRLPENYQQTSCAFFKALDSIEYGNASVKWAGIHYTVNNMTTLSSVFTSSFTSSTYDSTTPLATLTTASNGVTTALNGHITTSSSVVVDTANPSGGSNTVAPDIITNLGPATASGTWTGIIEAERASKKTLASSSATSIQTNYDKIKNDLSTYQGYIDTALSNMDGLNTLITDAQDQTWSWLKDGDNIVSNYVKNALLGMFIAALVMAFLTLVCPIFVCMCQKKCCNSLIFVAWEFFSLIMLIGFVIGVVSLVVGIIATQGCDTMYKSITVEGHINSITQFFSSAADYTQYINTCLTGDGNITATIGIKDAFSTLDAIKADIDAARPLFQSTNGGDSTSIPLYEAALTNTIDGKYLLVSSTSNTDGTAYNLAALNKLSDYTKSGSTQGCSVSRDQWVMNTVNCTYSYVWASPDANDANLGSPTCLGVDSSVSTTGRYSGKFTSCTSGIETSLDDLRLKIQDQYNDGQTKLGAVKTDLTTTVQSAWDTFKTAIYGVTVPIEDLDGDINSVTAIVSDPTAGLYNNWNCSFFHDDMATLNYAMCSGLVVNFYQITLAMLIMAAFASIGSLFQFCFAKYMRAVIEEKEREEKENKSRT